jgi:hypothetical protein
MLPSLSCTGKYQPGHPLLIASPPDLSGTYFLAILDVSDPLAPSPVCTINVTSYANRPIQWLISSWRVQRVQWLSGSEFVLVQNRPNRLLGVDVARRSVTTIRELNGDVILARLSPDRAWLATMESKGNASRVARLYGRGVERTLATFPQLPGPLAISTYWYGRPTIEFSPDGTRVLAADWQASMADPTTPNLQLFDLEGSRIISDSRGRWAAWVRASLYYATGDNKVHMWADGAPPVAVLESAWLQPAVSPDGQSIAYLTKAGNRYNFEVMETKSGKAKTLNTTGQRVEALFVTSGLLWAGELGVCDDCQGGWRASGKVFAYDISTGVEREVRLPNLLYLHGASRSTGA